MDRDTTDLQTWVCRCESALLASGFVCLLVTKPICRVATDSLSLPDFCSSPCQGPIFNPTTRSVLGRDLKIQSNHTCITSSQPLQCLPRNGRRSVLLNVILKTIIIVSRFCQADSKSSRSESSVFQFVIKYIKNKIYRTVILPVVLYGSEAWSLTLREELRLRVLENWVPRSIFGPKRTR